MTRVKVALIQNAPVVNVPPTFVFQTGLLDINGS